MATELQGADVEFLVREFNTGEFKRMVCEDTLVFDAASDVSTVKTKICGTFKGVRSPDYKANGSAVFNVEPGGSEVSYDEVLGWQDTTTKVDFIIRNLAFGTFDAGEAIRISGSGYFVNSQSTFNDGEVAKFTWNLEVVGTLNTVES